MGSSPAFATGATTDAAIALEQQQTTSITVTVVDSKGEPVIGANVVQKGTTNGTITDIDGIAKLSVPRGTTLQVSFVGFKEQEVKASGLERDLFLLTNFNISIRHVFDSHQHSL